MDELVLPGRPAGREGVYVLRGLLICGLIITAGLGQGLWHAAFRGALPLLAGLVMGTALTEADSAGRTISLRWALHLMVMWAATLSPAMWGNREVLRTCSVAGALAVLIRGGRRTRVLAWTGVAGIVVVALSRQSWLQGSAGELQYALGGAWPRGWGTSLGIQPCFWSGAGWRAGRGYWWSRDGVESRIHSGHSAVCHSPPVPCSMCS
jgi:hypothetical protein